jgi:hypothetical protein
MVKGAIASPSTQRFVGWTLEPGAASVKQRERDQLRRPDRQWYPFDESAPLHVVPSSRQRSRHAAPRGLYAHVTPLELDP